MGLRCLHREGARVTEEEHEAHRVRERATQEEIQRRGRRKWRGPLGLKWAGNGEEDGL